MRIEVDVRKVEQSCDLDTGVTQNYLILDVCGLEVRAPCTEEQLQAVVRATQRAGVAPAPEPRARPEVLPSKEFTYVSPVMFESREDPPAPRHTARMVRRPVEADDAGIEQG